MPTIGGGSSQSRGGGGGGHRSGEKTGGFMHILAYKSPEAPLFAQKYLTRYTPETFEEYMNFETHYLKEVSHEN